MTEPTLFGFLWDSKEILHANYMHANMHAKYAPKIILTPFGLKKKKKVHLDSVQFSSVQSLSLVRLFVIPWTSALQASLSITSSQSLPKLLSIESVMPSNHLILCHPLLLLPSIFPRIRVFSNESALHIRWPNYWSFSFNSPSNEHPGLISFRTDWLDVLPVQGSLKSLLQQHNWNHQVFGVQLSL